MKLLKRAQSHPESRDVTRVQRPTPPPLAADLIEGYLQGIRETLQKKCKPEETIRISMDARDRIEKDCSRFYVRVAGSLVRSSTQARRAGYEFYRARNGQRDAFNCRDTWSGRSCGELRQITAEFARARVTLGRDGVLKVA